MPHRSTCRLTGRAAPAALLAFGLFITSCTVTERQVAQQGSRIDVLQEQVIRLERALAEGSGAALAVTAPDPQQARRLADLGQRVEELAAQLRAVEGRLDAASQRGTPEASPLTSASLGKLEQELKALAVRMAELESSSPPAPAPTPAPASTPALPTPAPLSSQQLYDQGYALYKQARYDDARQQLRRYATEYPDTKLTDNALFWIGESYYDQAQYEQAILEYDKVIQKFPQADKVPSALLKQAFAFDAIGDPTDAKILLRKVLREHPDSEQAVIARKKLEILGD
ncbi:MAG: tol-pal system protein YbgF [Deferrisomatales bacterium]|nr:tol-pal system protein YbgF [Deferrisomatales bacterium]